MIGRQVGNYRVVRLIDTGGMGAVYEAQHLYRKTRAAIKVLLPAFAKDPALVERLFNEARAVDAVQHPGIVHMLDCGQLEPDQSPYLIMELLDGQSLAQRLEAQGGALPPSEWPLLARIAETMAAAHAQGIIHRDLKPANIMLLAGAPDRPGAIKVLDFGIAKIAEAHQRTAAHRAPTAAGALLGTPPYMAPEQWRDVGTVDARTDVYALGVMLFQCTSGHLPFVGSIYQLMRMHVEDPAPDLRTLCPSAPAAVAALAARMLAKDPAARPSMAEVAADLLAATAPPPPREPAAPRERAPGQRLGNYRLLQRLGSGGYGAVFLAEHLHVAGLKVAIKVLHPDMVQRPAAAARFAAEARAIAAVDHPGIVQIKDFGQEGGAAYLVMEHLAGVTLRTWLDAPGADARRVGVGLLRQVAAALRAAHGAGIVHRDLKPDNIMVVPGAAGAVTAKVVDFGVAKLAEDRYGSLAQKAQTAQPLGTAAYMAPEQWRVEPVTDRADVYALGVLLYECLGGRRPFSGNVLGLMDKHLNQAPRPLVEIDATLPPELCDLALRMLAKSPADRPTMAEVEAILGADVDTLREPTPPQVAAPPVQVPDEPPPRLAAQVPNEPRPHLAEQPLGEPPPPSAAQRPSETRPHLAAQPPREPLPAAPYIIVDDEFVDAAISEWTRTHGPLPIAVATEIVDAPTPALPARPAREPAVQVLAVPPAKKDAPRKWRWQRLLAIYLVVGVLLTCLSLLLQPQKWREPHSRQAPSTVTWDLRSDPPGAEVRRVADGTLVGKTPLFIEMEQGTGGSDFELSFESYKPSRITLLRDKGGSRTERLEGAVLGGK